MAKITILFVLLFCSGVVLVGSTGGVDNKCMTEFMPCLSFATGNDFMPGKNCCVAATWKNADPACLCSIFLMVHNGSSAAVGIRDSSLLLLPNLCATTVNVSVSGIKECPRLLHLAPNSHDAAIFTNNSSPPTTVPRRVSIGVPQKPRIGVSALAAVVMIAFLAFQ